MVWGMGVLSRLTAAMPFYEQERAGLSSLGEAGSLLGGGDCAGLLMGGGDDEGQVELRDWGWSSRVMDQGRPASFTVSSSLTNPGIVLLSYTTASRIAMIDEPMGLQAVVRCRYDGEDVALRGVWSRGTCGRVWG